MSYGWPIPKFRGRYFPNIQHSGHEFLRAESSSRRLRNPTCKVLIVLIVAVSTYSLSLRSCSICGALGTEVPGEIFVGTVVGAVFLDRVAHKRVR